MYSIHFREAALRLYEYFGSMRKTADALKVSIASISRWTKEINPKKRSRQCSKTTDAVVAFVKNSIHDNPSITCSEIRQEIYNLFNYTISRQLVHLILKRLDFSYT
jgi:transposase